jgi:hypothetical protein
MSQHSIHSSAKSLNIMQRNTVTLRRGARGFAAGSLHTGRTACLAARFGLLALAFGIATMPAFAQNQPSAPTCHAALELLLSEWRSIGFVEPVKPAQAIVTGQHGRTTTTGRFNYMVQQIRLAAKSCEAGRNDEALAHISAVRGVLDRAGPN